MSEPNNSELYSLITNVYKPPKIFDFPETEQPFDWFEKFHGFVIFGGMIEPITYLVFYLIIRMWENLYKKPYQTWRTAVKAFKKHQNVPKGTHEKKQILFHRFLGEYTLFLIAIHFERGNENYKILDRRRGPTF